MVTRPYKPYFTGTANNLGIVNRIDATNFSELLDNSFLLAQILNITRQQYAQMDKQKRSDAKRVPWVTAAWYDFDSGDRASPNPRGAALVCIDIDDPIAAKPYYASPNTISNQLGELSFILYETATSTHTAPRLRLVVDADLPLDRYADGVREIATRIGLAPNHLTPESLRPNQPMFLPTSFADDGDMIYPIITYRKDGTTLRVDDLAGDAPKKQEVYCPPDAIDFLRSRVEGLDISDINEMLDYLNPDCGYDDWLVVAAAIKHQFGGTDKEDDAYAAFDQWSAKGKKYVGKEDTLAKWNSLRPNTMGKLPVTVRTIISRAKEEGWDGVSTTQKVFNAFLLWIHGGIVASKSPLQDGMNRLAGMPELSPIEEELCLKELSGAVTRVTGNKHSIISLRKELKHVRRKAEERRRQERDANRAWPKWSLGLIYIENHDCFYRPATATKISPSALNRSHGRYLADDPTIVAEGREPRAEDYLLHTVKCPVAWDMMYDPASNKSRYVYNGLVFVNTYVPSHPEPDPAQEAYARDLLLRHMDNLIGDPFMVEMILSYFAYMVQYPGMKIRWSILLQGVEGCGKSFLTAVAETILGKRNVNPLRYSTIAKGWSEWAKGVQLVAVEEIRVSGQNRKEFMDVLKPLITNDTISIDQKNKDSAIVPNKTNYLFYTNHHDALSLDANDRRYLIWWSPLQFTDDLHRAGMDADYFTKLFDMTVTHGGGLRSFFENYQISDAFNPNGPAPRTRFREMMISETQCPLTCQIEEILRKGSHPLIGDVVCSSLAVKDVADAIGTYTNSSHISSALKALKYLPFDDTYVTLKDGRRHRLYVHASHMRKYPECNAKWYATLLDDRLQAIDDNIEDMHLL